MTTVVVLDISPDYWAGEHLPIKLAEALDLALVILRSAALQLAWEAQPAVALIAAFPEGAEYLYAGDFNEQRIKSVRGSLEKRVAARADGQGLTGEALVSQGLCMAACFVKKHSKGSLRGRIVLLETSAASASFNKQSVEISNCGWALSQEGRQAPTVDLVSLGGPKTAAVLGNIVKKTGGTHIPPSLTRSAAAALQAVLFLSTSQSEGILRLIQPKTSETLDMGAVCSCHANPIECGYICSVCLAVYCSEASGLCAVCGSRIRREIRDELPLNQKTFTQVQP